MLEEFRLEQRDFTGKRHNPEIFDINKMMDLQYSHCGKHAMQDWFIERPSSFSDHDLCADQIKTSTSRPGKARAFNYLLCPGSGEFDICLRGVGKIEPEVSGSFFLGSEVANSYKTRIWTRWKSLKEEI